MISFKVNRCNEKIIFNIYQRGSDIHNHKQMLKGDVSDNASKKAKLNSNGIHIGYKRIILSILDDEQEITSFFFFFFGPNPKI